MPRLPRRLRGVLCTIPEAGGCGWDGGAEQHEQQYQCHHNTLAFKNEAQSHHQQAADKEKRAGQTVRFVPNRRIREGPGSADAEKEVAFDFRQMWPRNTKSRPTRTVTVLGTLIFPGEKASDTMMPTMTSKKSSSSSTKES